MTPPIQPHLDIFQRNDIDKLYNLTRKLWRQGTFQYYLNNQQLLVLQCILDSSDCRVLFEKFMGSQISFKFVERAKLKSQDTDEANKKTQDNETQGNSQQQQQQQQQEDISYTDSSIANGVESARQLALRIRYVLWDAAIDYYYDTEQDTMEEPYALFEDSDDEQVEESKGSADAAAVATTDESKETEVKQGRAIAEDDDYDDEDEEDEEQEKKKEEEQQQPDSAEPAAQQTISHETDDHGNIILEVPIVDNDEDLHQLDNKILMSNFNKIYHNFEHDKETLVKRQKLEENDKLLEENAEEEEDDDDEEVQETTKDGNPLVKKESTAKSKKDSQLSMNLGAANLSLKHLLRTIESNKSKLSLSDIELRQLITEVRKNRSKWASDDKIGQEELYEACEKVIIELRNHTEHSTAFLNKVSKRDAPNYYQIIKRPMDLNTILKKLKTFQYKSKSEFVEDVMLIWKNCLQFNTDPKHFLRAHAIAMQKKSLGLIHLIPDITVKDRKEVEEAFKDQDDGSATPAPSGGKNTAGKGKKRSRNGEVLEKKEVADAEEHKVKEEEKEESVVPPSTTTDTATETTTTGDDVAMVDGSVLEDEDADGDSNEYLNVEDNDKDDMEMQTWKNLTAKTRADYCIARSVLFEQRETEAEKQQPVKAGEPELKKQKVEHQQPFRLNPDAPALVRDKKNMREFEKFLGSYQSRKRTFKSEDPSLENDAEQEQEQEHEDQSSAAHKESKPYLIEYDINGGIPGIPYAGVSGLQLDQEEQKLIDQVMQTGLQPSCYSASDSNGGGLNKVINSNIELMQEIRRICYKISIIRQMQQQHHIHHSHLKPAPYNPIDDTVDLDPISRLPNREKHDKRVVFEVLRKRVAKLAMQTGFESAGGFAIDTLTQITGDYMDNLMRTIKTHLESPSVNRQQKHKNVLRLALLQNGITKFDELHGYVHENVIRQTGKLQELKGKLSGFLKSLLRPAVQDLNEGVFADNSEQFMNGDFSNELGDDFFGFKELGLDKELGVLGNTIPLHLLQSRLADQSQSDTTGQPSRPAFEWYRPDPVQEDAIKLQIKTFQPFLAQVLHKTKLAQSKQFKTKREIADYMDSKTNLTLPEEEDYNKRTNKSKLPPNGKIIVTLKKKLSAISYYIPEDTEMLQPEPIQTSQPRATKPVNVKQEKKTKGKQQQQSNNLDEESDGDVGKLKNEVGSDTSLMF